uniref:circadian clock protein PASD1 isoform X2 n=1 Tax=Ictidomys tridecemlineatus TaxID=43179 RepID=UPI001A9EF9FB|nr:circadian clock protein PASD1 isoform X2 [Ictidomys tridecemlineatus]
MEEDQRGNRRRDAPAKPEKAKKEGIGNLFKELRAMLQNHGYPAKGDKSRALQSTSAILQRKEVKLNPGGSRDKTSWVPFFHNYEDFNQMMLQSLDGFMIILSTDGVIMFVAENVMSLLGHLPRDIVGKKLLSFLHDEEKTEVYRKITLKLPLACSVGNHVEFCCYLKRGNVELEESPTYEYVKFILSLKHICNESLMFFGGFNPKCTCPATSIASNLLWEDQFYFVGTVCVLRSEVLKELHTAKQSSETIVVQDSDEEHTSGDRRSPRRQRRSYRMESRLSSESAIVSLDDEVDIVEVEQYGAQESVHIIQIDSSSSSSSDTSISSSGIMPESPTSSSLQSLEFESEMDLRKREEPIDLEYSVDSEYIDDSMDQDDVIDLVSQEASVEPDFEENSLDSVYQEDEVELVEQELYPASSKAASGDAQMRRMTLRRIFSPEPHSSGMMSRNQYAGKMKRSVADFKEAKRFRNSFSCLKYTEDLEETCVSSTQDNLQEQDQYLQEELQEEDEPIDSPVEIEDDEQETIDYYNDEDFDHKDKSHSLFPEEQDESFMDPLPSAHSRSSETISLSCFPQSPVSTASSIDALETPEDFMQLWQEPPSPHDLDEHDTWLSNDQNSTQDSPTWQQVQAPDVNIQGSRGPDAIEAEAAATSKLEVPNSIQSSENSNSRDSGDLGDPGEPGDAVTAEI